MYDIIYQFLLGSLFNGGFSATSYEIGGATMNGNEWLAHSFTIVTLALLFVCACLFVKWLFKLVAGMFTGIGR